MTTILNPESALKRAQELLNIDQKLEALQVLHDFISTMCGRTWHKTLERIMFKYVEICVDMRKGMFAKDGLLQYRHVCLQVNVASLEEVVKHFLRLSTERAENAWIQARALYHDLEAEKSSEDLMISYVSGKNAKDRSEQEIVTPWFEFLWDTYTTVLEILRDNSKLQTLYSKMVLQALRFCKQYNQTTEFCRLCENIRNHQANLNKYKDQGSRYFSVPENLHLYLGTRFEQLHIATELALWQEAFRLVEDIHGLMCMAKETPEASTMVVYYAKLAEIFWVANSPLYHAYARVKIFSLRRSHNINFTSKDLKLIASSSVLAALSVVPYDHMCGASRDEFENEKDHNMKMVNLIGFGLEHNCGNRKVLSRSELFSEIVAEGVMFFASQEVKDLYNLLKLECIPLDVGLRVQHLLTKIFKMGGKLSFASSVLEINFAQYVPALEKLATLRLIQQVSKVYQTIKLSVLSEMVPFFDYPTVEKVVVEAMKYKFIDMKINHSKGVAIFGDLDLESEKWRDHLTILAEQLNKSRSQICPPVKKAVKLGISLHELAETRCKEDNEIQARKLIIEERKKENERVMLEMEHEEAKNNFFDEVYRTTIEERKEILKYENFKKQTEIECRKVEKMTQEELLIYFNVLEPSNKKRMRRKPLTDNEVLLKLDMLLHMKAVPSNVGKAVKTMSYMKRENEKEDVSLIDEETKINLDPEEKDIKDVLDLCRRKMMEDPISLETNAFTLMERREKKLQNLAKTMDYLVKAKREEEVILRDDAFLKHFNEEQVIYECKQQQEIEQSQICHIIDLEEKTRLAQMLDKKIIFQNKITRKREAEHDWLMSERAKVLRIQKQERITKRKMLFYVKIEIERHEKTKAIINEVFEVVERQRQIVMDIKEKAVSKKVHQFDKIEKILDMYGMLEKTWKPTKFKEGIEWESNKEKDEKTKTIEQLFYNFFENNPSASSSGKDVEKECPDKNF